MLEELKPHELFNMISNMNSVVAVDLRGADRFSSSRIVGSTHVDFDCETCSWVDDVERTILNKSSRCRQLILVLIVGALDSKVLPIVRSQWESSNIRDRINEARSLRETSFSTSPTVPDNFVISTKYLWFEEFEKRYHRCPSLLVGNKEPTRRVYYASEIIPDFLFLGDCENGSDKTQLESLGITHIIDATGVHLSESSASELKISYLPVDIWDNEDSDISNFFPATNAFIAAAEAASSTADKSSRVLVHCHAGVSRSASLVLAYLMSARGMTLRDALNLVLRQRPIILPNPAFRDQLRRYESSASGPDGGGSGGARAPSVADDEDMLAVVRSLNTAWGGAVAAGPDTDHERVPIACLTAWAADKGPPPEHIDPAAAAAAGEAKPKRPFLRKGAGGRGAAARRGGEAGAAEPEQSPGP